MNKGLHRDAIITEKAASVVRLSHAWKQLRWSCLLFCILIPEYFISWCN